jgi:conjugative transposon TraJ protein
VWRHLANAEPIDFYPLLRPFAIGLCILLFPWLLAVINGVMTPTVTGTRAMVEGSEDAIERLLDQKEQALRQTSDWWMYVGPSGQGNYERWYKYTYDNADPEGDNLFESIGNDIRFSLSKAAYQFRHSVKEWMNEILQVLFVAAALCINTLRTFQLVVLAILGPIVFGLAVFDGFHHTLTVWLARYINVFLWLPVANIFGAIIGKIQEKMIELDISQIGQSGDTFFSAADTGYLVFMVIGIVGYFTVPSVANYIVHAASGGALTYRVTNLFGGSVRKTASTVTAGAVMATDAFGNAAGSMRQSMSSQGLSSDYFKDKGDNNYSDSRIRGNT